MLSPVCVPPEAFSIKAMVDSTLLNSLCYLMSLSIFANSKSTFFPFDLPVVTPPAGLING